MKFIFNLLWLFPLFASCNKSPVERSFYYWKGQSELLSTKYELGCLEDFGVQHSYVHYMDIDWSETRGIPIPTFWPRDYDAKHALAQQNFTPVVFITNKTFEKISDAWCDSLAKKVAYGIKLTTLELRRVYRWYSIYDDKLPNADSLAVWNSFKRIDEIQIDCDWTKSTRDKYFLFLTKLKKHFLELQLSATIRLYPYKYTEQMGVPPVDKGLLMCYNMDNVKDLSTKNSVFDLATLESYIEGTKQKMKLDVALPIFGWYAWFRNNEFKGILYEQQIGRLDSAILNIDNNNLRLTKDIALDKHYLREGDILRLEFPDKNELVKAADYLTKELDDVQRIAFYHCDLKNIYRYEETIHDIYSRH